MTLTFGLKLPVGQGLVPHIFIEILIKGFEDLLFESLRGLLVGIKPRGPCQVDTPLFRKLTSFY